MTIEIGNLVYVKMWPIPFPIYEHPSQMYALFGYKKVEHAMTNQHHKEVTIFPDVHYFDSESGTRFGLGVVISKHVYSHRIANHKAIVNNFFCLLLPGFSTGMWFTENDVVSGDRNFCPELKPVFFKEEELEDIEQKHPW